MAKVNAINNPSYETNTVQLPCSQTEDTLTQDSMVNSHSQPTMTTMKSKQTYDKLHHNKQTSGKLIYP